MTESLQFIARFSGAIVFLISAAVLAGWIFRLEAILHPARADVFMKPNTAMGFIVCVVSLWLLRKGDEASSGTTGARLVGLTCASLVFLLGVVTLGEYIFGFHSRVDELFVSGLTPQGAVLDPWRMGAASAFAFVFLGIALLALHGEGQQSASAAQSVACVTFLIWIFGALDDLLNPTVSQIHMPLLTVCNLGLVSLAIMLSRPNEGLMSVVVGENLGGSMARRLLPAGILLSLTVAWIRWKGEEFGYYDSELGVAVSTAFQIILLSVLIWANAKSLEKTDELRKRAEEVARREHEKVYGRAQREIADLLRRDEELQRQLADARTKSPLP